MKHLLSINGLDGPLTRILGCDCGHCTSPTRQAKPDKTTSHPSFSNV